MFEKLLGFFAENATLDKVVIVLTAATVAVDRAAAIIDKITAVVAALRAGRVATAVTALEDAVITTAKNAGTRLDGSNDLAKESGDALLRKAAATGVSLGEARGVDVEKVLGGKDGVEAATQSAFKRIKAALTPGK